MQMNIISPRYARGFAKGIGIGALAGALFLGAGGRLAMRLFALSSRPAVVLTLRGTLTVVLAGAIAGAIGGLMLPFAWKLPRGVLVRGVLFGLICYVLASPGFRPPRPITFLLFAPGFLLYGVCAIMLWNRTLASSQPVYQL
jgi:hypothetical protein